MGWNMCWRCAVLLALAWAALVLGYGLHDPWTHDWPVLWMAGVGPIVALFVAATLLELLASRKNGSTSRNPDRPQGASRP